ncbi:ATP-dependent Clp protease proteolytic subunit [Candidatus Saccharibacteria bacterium]|nr:ATP-dependent Clp protease proteolytic subunit [Candidatus Saccharibacteria bacterium]
MATKKPTAQVVHQRPDLRYFDLPAAEPRVNTAIDEYLHHKDIAERRLWFNTSVASMDDVDVVDSTTLLVTDIVHHIIQYNRDDENIPTENRKPIKLYVNSPGGDIYEGFALVDAIQLSKTPIYTYNVGTCASMAFLIYIAGHKRFTLPRAMFLLHDGFNGSINSSSKFIDTAEFSKRYEKEIVKAHVLGRTQISEEEYDKHLRVEWYMLPSDAIRLGVADKIASSMDDLL